MSALLEAPALPDIVDFLELSPDLICTHDLDGRILSANPAACRALGYSVEQLTRMTLCDVLTDKARRLYPSYIDALVGTGHAVGRMEVRTRAGDYRLWEYRNVLFAPSVAGGMARDVTDRARSYRTLYESELHFRTLVENGPDIISIVNPEGVICYHSLEAAQHLVGTSVFALVHPEDRPALAELMQRRSEAAQRIEIRLEARAGVWRSFEVLAKPMLRGSRIKGLLLNARDITERKMLEQQLEQAHRVDSLGRLAATVAHEFNNVLMGMMPFAELLQKREATRDLVARATQHIVNSIQRGKLVTHDILRYTQPAQPALEPLALDAWWASFIAEAQVLIGDNIVMRTSIEPLAVMADAGQLAQVFANLISNARDAMRKGGELAIRVCEAEHGFLPDPSGFVQISVSDTGTGMPPEVLEHIFEPLFTTKPNGGTGLGLAVTHQVIARHRGFIFAESAEGRGSTFHIFLPRATAPRPRLVIVERPPVAARRLLIVEDEEIIADGLQGLLVDEGFEALVASSGAEALELVRTFDPELVLLDVGLPDLDGTEVARRIRERHPDMPVIFMTGHGDVHAEAALRKPFAIDELLDRIAALERGA